MILTRRSAIFASTGLCGLALVGCATSATGGTIPAQILADVTAALTTLRANLTTIATTSPPLIPAATMTTILSDITTAQTAVATITAQTTATAGATVLQTVEGYLNAVLNALAAIPLIPAPFSTVIEAAALIAPEIESFVAATLGTVAVSAPVVKSGMSLSQARAVLGAAVVAR